MAPIAQTITPTVIAGAVNKRLCPVLLRTSGGVTHESRDGQSCSGITLNGRMKLSEVATQIQYLVVAVPRCIDVNNQAASQTIEAYRRWISRECDKRVTCSIIPLSSPALAGFAAGRRALQSLQVFQSERARLEQIGDE